MAERMPTIYIMRHDDGVFKLGSSVHPKVRRRQLLQTYGRGMAIKRTWPHDMATAVEMMAHASLAPFRAEGFNSREVYDAPIKVIVNAVESAIKYMEFR
jgi:hypothetical protein